MYRQSGTTEQDRPDPDPHPPGPADGPHRDPERAGCPDRGPSPHQTSYRLACEAIRDVLLRAERDERNTTGLHTTEHQICAALYSLLATHRVDRHGRCRACHRPGWPRRRRRVCMVYERSRYWLQQPPAALLQHLRAELDIPPTPAAPSPLLPAPRTAAEWPDPPEPSERPDDHRDDHRPTLHRGPGPGRPDAAPPGEHPIDRDVTAMSH